MIAEVLGRHGRNADAMALRCRALPCKGAYTCGGTQHLEIQEAFDERVKEAINDLDLDNNYRAC
jgi:hypothetical protein